MTLLDIFNHYGYTNQTAQLAEECGELIQAINKYGRNAKKANKQQLGILRKKIIEEIADVMVVLWQFMLFLGFNDETVLEIAELKIERQKKRVESEK